MKMRLTSAVLTVAALAAASAVQAAGLVAHWKLDESAGGTAADSAGTNDGTLNGNPVWQDAGGRIDGALQFDGGDDKVDVPYSAALNPAQFSFALWARPTGGAGTFRSPLTCRDDGPQRGYFLYAHQSDIWSFWIGTGSAWANLDGPPVVLNAWTHIACTYDGTTMRMYVNGADIGTTTTATLSANTARPFRIGAGSTEGSGNYFFPGRIDDVRIYNRALSDAEVYDLAGGIDSGLVVHYTFDNASNREEDTSGNDRHGTLIAGDYTAGQTGDAIRLDADGEYMEVPGLGIAEGSQVTIACWVRHTADGGVQEYFRNDEPDESLQLRAETAQHRLDFYFSDTGGTHCHLRSADDAFTWAQMQQWNHVAATYDGATIGLYLNGIEIASAPEAAVNRAVNLTSKLSWPGEPMKGMIDDVRVYSRALSATEIQVLAGGIDAGLVAHWKLDHKGPSDTTAYDETGNYDGTLTNMAGTEWTTGKIDGALDFDGADDYVSVGLEPGLMFTRDVTISAWVRVDAYAEWTGIAGWLHDSGSTESGYVLCTMGTDGLAFGLALEGGNLNYLTATGYSTGQWYHVVGVYDGSTQSVYIDGALADSVARTGNIDWNPQGLDGFEIGRYHDDNEDIPFDGMIDDVRVYGRALSAADVLELYELAETDVSVTALDATAEERPSSPDVATFQVTRVGPTGSDLAVNFTVTGGSATEGTDYQTLGGSVVIPAGQNTAIITVTPIDDTDIEGDETVEITLAAGDYQIGSPATASVTIADDDDMVSIVATDGEAFEDAGTAPGTGEFTVTLNVAAPFDVTVTFTVGGVASRDGPDDYDLSEPTDASITEPGGFALTIPTGDLTRTILVTPVQDTEGEGDEDVVVTVIGGSGYTPDPSLFEATVVIHDDEPKVIITEDVTAAAEGGAGGQATVSLLTWDDNPYPATVDVSLDVSGDATNGTDYAAIPSTLSFTAESSKVIAVAVVDDTLPEQAEDVVLMLTHTPGVSGYYLGPTVIAAVTIQDNEPTVSVTAAGADAEATEGAGDAAIFTVARVGDATNPFAVTYVLGGTAVPIDWQEALTGTVTIPASSASTTVTVTPDDDVWGEPDETLTLTIVDTTPDPTYHIGASSSATITIHDDEPRARVSATDATASEVGADAGEFKVTLVPAPAAPVDVRYRIAGTATPGDDYEALLGTLQVPISGVATIPVIVLDDNRFDDGETVVVTLRGNNGYYVTSRRTAVVRITDDERPGVAGGTGCSHGPGAPSASPWALLLTAMLLWRSGASRRRREPRLAHRFLRR